jgi:hypothetical protein
MITLQHWRVRTILYAGLCKTTSDSAGRRVHRRPAHATREISPEFGEAGCDSAPPAIPAGDGERGNGQITAERPPDSGSPLPAATSSRPSRPARTAGLTKLAKRRHAILGKLIHWLPKHRKFDDYTAKPVVRGRIELPTFRFSG